MVNQIFNRFVIIVDCNEKMCFKRYSQASFSLYLSISLQLSTFIYIKINLLYSIEYLLSIETF